MKLFEKLKKVLCTESVFTTDDGQLKRQVVIDYAHRYDPNLLQMLLAEPSLKEYFFSRVNDVLIFRLEEFVYFVEQKEFLNDSYTSFQNKIGLSVNDKFIAQGNNVELVWPYKDCVLEGGQTRAEQKRNEIFFNERLSHDEISQLFDPKAFGDATVVTAESQKNFEGFHRNEEGVITDNLVINGNNLLALHSLVREFRGKVKLIYIDPPYNTGTDTFGYNDKFNRSSWLTFMKNRLEIARELLTDDGAIYMQLDYHQVHYAKVLMDEIFGEENFQREIIWRIGWLSGYKTADKNWIRNHDTILFYSKDASCMTFNKHYIDKKDFKSIAKSNIVRYAIEDVWNGNEYDDLNSIAIVSFSGETVSKMLDKEDEVKGQKPEKLIERILNAHTEKGDIVLDFFAGSGTTAAVALKMNRQFIICEQLEKHLDIIHRRLIKVMQGEQSGISRRQLWSGGGEFITLELKKYNQYFINQIQAVSTKEQLLDIWTNIKDHAFFAFNVDMQKFERELPEFVELTLLQQKSILLSMLDKNQMYVNKENMLDERYCMSTADQFVTNEFYQR